MGLFKAAVLIYLAIAFDRSWAGPRIFAKEALPARFQSRPPEPGCDYAALVAQALGVKQGPLRDAGFEEGDFDDLVESKLRPRTEPPPGPRTATVNAPPPIDAPQIGVRDTSYLATITKPGEFSEQPWFIKFSDKEEFQGRFRFDPSTDMIEIETPNGIVRRPRQSMSFLDEARRNPAAHAHSTSLRLTEDSVNGVRQVMAVPMGEGVGANQNWVIYERLPGGRQGRLLGFFKPDGGEPDAFFEANKYLRRGDLNNADAAQSELSRRLGLKHVAKSEIAVHPTLGRGVFSHAIPDFVDIESLAKDPNLRKALALDPAFKESVDEGFILGSLTGDYDRFSAVISKVKDRDQKTQIIMTDLDFKTPRNMGAQVRPEFKDPITGRPNLPLIRQALAKAKTSEDVRKIFSNYYLIDGGMAGNAGEIGTLDTFSKSIAKGQSINAPSVGRFRIDEVLQDRHYCPTWRALFGMSSQELTQFWSQRGGAHHASQNLGRQRDFLHQRYRNLGSPCGPL
ncbi:MAG: hypothetical protein IT289_00290 [Oligoflexia bacterium]|nr:hypothetical protein [Oligoflexia bacterium]